MTINTSFRDTTASGWVFGGSSGSTDPYLTANSVDSPGNGWLRLTENSTDQSTYALYDDQIFSVNAQIQITMDYASWNGTGADGITFFLVDGNVNASTFSPGAYGGSLGYAQKTGIPGMNGGYLGFGLDDWGNYSNGSEGRNGGITNDGTLYPNRIAVRGPESSNYEFVAASDPLESLPGGGQMDFPSYTTRPDQTGADYRSFRITLDANNQLTVDMKFGASGSYATMFTADLSGYQRPDTFKIGFTGSTGDSTEIHEVRNVGVTMTPWAATAKEWDNGAGTTAWGTAANWVGDALPTTNADILFGDKPSSGPQTATLNTSMQLNSITFDSGYNYTMNGTGTVTLGDTSLVGLPSINVNDYNGAQAQHALANNLSLAEKLTINNYSFSSLCLDGTFATNGNDFDVRGTGAVNFNGAITGSGDLTKGGTGITTINNNNSSWTGNVTVNSGQLVVTSDGALGTTAGTTTVNSGGALVFRDPTGSGLTYATAEAVTISGLGVDHGREGMTGAIYNDGGNNSFAGNITLAADSGIGSRDGVLTLSGVVSGGYGLTKLGEGVVSLTGTNTYTGSTTIAGGALRVTTSSLPGGYDTTDTGSNYGAVNLAGGVLELASSTTFTRSVGTGEEQIYWSGDGGFSAYGGNRTVTLSGGTMTWGSGSFVPTGNALLLGSKYATGNLTFSNAINLGNAQREVRVADGTAAVDGTLSGNLTGTGGGLVKTGAGTLNLTGTNSYTGATEIQGGALRGNISSSSNLVLNGGVRELTANFSGNLGTSGGQVQWAGDGGFSASGANRTVNLNGGAGLTWGTTSNFVAADKQLIFGSTSANRTLTLSNALNLGSSGNRTIRTIQGTMSGIASGKLTGVVSGAANLNVTGNGRLDLTANNTHTGAVNVSGAELRLSGSGDLAQSSGFTINQGGTLTLDNSGTYSSNRMANTAGITLNGGTFAYFGRTTNSNSTETVGAISLTGGGNTIDVVNNRSGKYARLTSASLGRSGAATVDFTNSVQTNGAYASSGNNPELKFTSSPALTNGILAYATVNGAAFATTSSGYIVAATGTNTAQGSWTSTINAAPTSDQTMTANRTVNSLLLGSGIDVNAGGYKLTLNSGGLLSTGATGSVISNGTLTSGSGNEVIAHSYGAGGLNISAVIADNGSAVGLTKAGTGQLTLSGTTANTFTGDTHVNDGTLTLAKSAGVTALAGNVYVGDGRGTDILQLNANEQIASTATVTLTGGQYTGETILQFNGSGNAGVTQTLANLDVSGQAVIDFAGGGVCDANFLKLDNLSVDAGSDLFVRNWIDFTDYLLVSKTDGFDVSVLSHIHFEGYADGAYTEAYDGDYWRITPVPEPAATGAVLAGLGLLAWLWVRRRKNTN